MNKVIKSFEELDIHELYAILALRSEIFVVEQDCVYQDIDFKDQKSFHLMIWEQNKLVAYTRIFKGGDYFKESSIGRVLVKEKFRGDQLGHLIMKESLRFIHEELKEQQVCISAQKYLVKFYESHGFQTFGESYLEDGIPHVQMKL